MLKLQIFNVYTTTKSKKAKHRIKVYIFNSLIDLYKGKQQHDKKYSIIESTEAIENNEYVALTFEDLVDNKFNISIYLTKRNKGVVPLTDVYHESIHAALAYFKHYLGSTIFLRNPEIEEHFVCIAENIFNGIVNKLYK